MTNICAICGCEFEAIKSTKKYCSNECVNAARRARRDQRIINGGSDWNRDRVCPLCGEHFQVKSAAANQRTCCYNCMPEGTQLTRGMFLAKIKQARGGRCIRCEYDKCIKALEFHHLDPSQKDFTISNDRFKLMEAIEESKKCILVCSNCHKELHDNMWSINELNLKESEEVES